MKSNLFEEIEASLKILEVSIDEDIQKLRNKYRSNWKKFFKNFSLKDTKEASDLLMNVNGAHELLESKSNEDFEEFLKEYINKNEFNQTKESNMEKNKKQKLSKNKTNSFSSVNKKVLEQENKKMNIEKKRLNEIKNNSFLKKQKKKISESIYDDHEGWSELTAKEIEFLKTNPGTNSETYKSFLKRFKKYNKKLIEIEDIETYKNNQETQNTNILNNKQKVVGNDKNKNPLTYVFVLLMFFLGGFIGYSIVENYVVFNEDNKIDTSNDNDDNKLGVLQYYNISPEFYNKKKIFYYSNFEKVTMTDNPLELIYHDKNKRIKGILTYNCSKLYPNKILQPIEINGKFDYRYKQANIKNGDLFSQLCPEWKQYKDISVNTIYEKEYPNWNSSAKILNFTFFKNDSFDTERGAFLCQQGGYANKFTFFDVYKNEWPNWKMPESQWEKELLIDLNIVCKK